MTFTFTPPVLLERHVWDNRHTQTVKIVSLTQWLGDHGWNSSVVHVSGACEGNYELSGFIYGQKLLK